MNNTSLQFDLQHIWHPYTSMISPLPAYMVDSASGVNIKLEDGTELIDGMASWWSVIHGYNNSVINDAVTEQLSKMAHVMFGGLTHQPAIDLCKTLVDITPEPLQKVFLADSGSVSVEVSLKMAIQYWRGQNKPLKNKFVALKHGYHGDTFGAMSVCDPENSMHSIYSDILPTHFFADAPAVKFDESWEPNDLNSISNIIVHNHNQLAAVILEPIVQGAGGMRTYHPEYLAGVRALCDQYDLLLIADEIATGFGRTGKMFACEHANISPDIMCLGKAITGGYMSLAATLCTEEVGKGVSKADAGVLMHGPTFMGNPLACATANASLALLLNSNWKENIATIETHLKKSLSSLHELNHVTDVRVLGAIGVIEMAQTVNVAEIQKQFIEKGIWLRPFGKLIYMMPIYTMTQSELEKLTTSVIEVITSNSGILS